VQGNPAAFPVPELGHLYIANHFIPMQIVSAHSPQGRRFKISHGLGESAIMNSTETTAESPSNCRVLTELPSLKMETEEVVVRKEKIDAALRSKPQRGRKRDNLSIHERLELTRTRNREHAKSTRYVVPSENVIHPFHSVIAVGVSDSRSVSQKIQNPQKSKVPGFGREGITI
jgi:hypothetical protein